MVSRDVPECAENNIRQRRVGVGEVRDQPAVMVKVERGGDVVAGFVPVIREAQESKVREGDYGEKEWKEDEVGECGEAVDESGG